MCVYVFKILFGLVVLSILLFFSENMTKSKTNVNVPRYFCFMAKPTVSGMLKSYYTQSCQFLFLIVCVGGI